MRDKFKRAEPIIRKKVRSELNEADAMLNKAVKKGLDLVSQKTAVAG